VPEPEPDVPEDEPLVVVPPALPLVVVPGLLGACWADEASNGSSTMKPRLSVLACVRLNWKIFADVSWSTSVASGDSVTVRTVGTRGLSDALEAITMQSKAINAAQSKLASKSMDARQFQSISNDLAQNASQLEARGYNNLAARLNDQAEMGSKLASINAELGAKAQSINYASAAANRANNVSDAMNRLNAALASRQAEYASHAAASINFASRDLASRQASNREVASKALAAMQELGARPEVAAKLDAKLASRLSAKAN